MRWKKCPIFFEDFIINEIRKKYKVNIINDDLAEIYSTLLKINKNDIIYHQNINENIIKNYKNIKKNKNIYSYSKKRILFTDSYDLLKIFIRYDLKKYIPKKEIVLIDTSEIVEIKNIVIEQLLEKEIKYIFTQDSYFLELEKKRNNYLKNIQLRNGFINEKVFKELFLTEKNEKILKELYLDKRINDLKSYTVLLKFNKIDNKENIIKKISNIIKYD